VLVARSGEVLATLAKEIEEVYKVTCLFIADDLVHHTVPYNVYQMCKDKDIRIDYLVNNAGF
jgi:short-subunit dehydrogenase